MQYTDNTDNTDMYVLCHLFHLIIDCTMDCFQSSLFHSFCHVHYKKSISTQMPASLFQNKYKYRQFYTCRNVIGCAVMIVVCLFLVQYKCIYKKFYQRFQGFILNPLLELFKVIEVALIYCNCTYYILSSIQYDPVGLKLNPVPDV